VVPQANDEFDAYRKSPLSRRARACHRFKPTMSLAAKLRRIALNQQGLLRAESFGRGKRAVLRAIERLGYVQIDTISVVERAHHHVLWSRVPNYSPRHLEQLVSERKLFEYWYHAAAFLPMADYRFS
jgi:uncharacterized protein YcaQ